MLWADEAGRTRRPIVIIEDHLYHTAELLDAVAAAMPAMLPHVAVCALDRSGPDTTATIARLADRYPAVRVATLDDVDASSLGAFARGVGKLLRPGGIVVQDVQLTTLPFIPADRWWESIYLGATIRGLSPERPPVVRFFSNKRGYDATFGKELLEAGFDPRDVMDKTAIPTVVAPAIARLFASQFPLTMRVSHADGASPFRVSEVDRGDVKRAAGIVLWRSAAATTVGGRALSETTALRAGSPEIETWRQLIDDRIAGGDGVPVVDVGGRLAEPGAERAEMTNLAARHLHGLRARLRDEAAIVTANHRYAIRPDVTVAIV